MPLMTFSARNTKSVAHGVSKQLAGNDAHFWIMAGKRPMRRVAGGSCAQSAERQNKPQKSVWTYAFSASAL